MTLANYGRSEKTIKYPILLCARNDLKLTTPYRHHHVLKLMKTSDQSHQQLLMQLGKILESKNHCYTLRHSWSLRCPFYHTPELRYTLPCLILLLLLRFATFTKLTMLVPPHAASQYIVSRNYALFSEYCS